jgi:hypothetical protein
VTDITKDDVKQTPWAARHSGKQFKGKRLPFGCLIDFLPSPIADPLPKFAPRAQPGVFVGWRLHPGGTWRNEYLVVPLHIMMDDTRERLMPQTVREIVVPDNIVFPLKDTYDQARRTLPHDEIPVVVPPSPIPPQETAPEWDVLREAQAADEQIDDRDEMDLILGEPGPSRPPPPTPLPPDVVAPPHPHPPIVLPPVYEDHDPYTGLPPNCVEVPGGYNVGGQFVKHVQGTSRVPWIWPELWGRFGQSRRDKLAADWELIKRRLATARATGEIPAMPVRPYTAEHRDKIPDIPFPFNAAVARPVSKK